MRFHCHFLVSAQQVGIGSKEKYLRSSVEKLRRVGPRSSFCCGTLGSTFRFLLVPWCCSALDFQVRWKSRLTPDHLLCFLLTNTPNHLPYPLAPSMVFLESMEICQRRLQKLCWLTIFQEWPTWHLTAQEWCPSGSFLTENLRASEVKASLNSH